MLCFAILHYLVVSASHSNGYKLNGINDSGKMHAFVIQAKLSVRNEPFENQTKT